jgi:hypothetical protein
MVLRKEKPIYGKTVEKIWSRNVVSLATQADRQVIFPNPNSLILKNIQYQRNYNWVRDIQNDTFYICQ